MAGQQGLRITTLMQLVALALLAALVRPTAGIKELSPWVQGIITHYGGAQDRMDPDSPSFGTKDGACGYGGISKDKYPYFVVAALSPQNQFYKAGPLNGCGECFQIQCVDPRPGVCNKDASGQPMNVVVMISDECPECEADHIDVQSLSFAKLANPAIGRIQTQYRRVECTPPDDMKVAVLDFRGGGGWVRLSIDTTGGRGSVRSVSVKTGSSTSWQALQNTWGAQWETASSPPAPLDFKIECDDGETVVAYGVIKQSGISAPLNSPIKFNTGVQFTITDPAFKGAKVASFNGPPDSAPNPGNSSNTSPAATSASAASACVDLPAPGSYSCQQQKDWGKCADPMITDGGFCAATCGRCQPSAAVAALANASQPASIPPSGEPPAAGPEPGTPASATSPPPSPSSAASGGSCEDQLPAGQPTCEMWKSWTKEAPSGCTDTWLVSNNFCAKTCGRCGAGQGQAAPPVASFSGPSGGRRMLRRQL